MGKVCSKVSGREYHGKEDVPSSEESRPLVGAVPAPNPPQNLMASVPKAHLAEGPGSDFHTGQRLEYLSDSQGCWIDCEVSSLRPKDGAVQVNVRPGYWFVGHELSERLRIPQNIPEGKEMEYYSASHGTWIPCKVVASREEDGAVQVNVKPGVWLDAAQRKSLLRDPYVQRRPTGHEIFEAGRQLEYFSLSMKGWIPCKVVATREDGAVEVDVKPGHWMQLSEQAAKLRDPIAVAKELQGPAGGEKPGQSGKNGTEREASYELVEKPGLLFDEDQTRGKVSSVEEAERLVLSNPGKYAGYSWQTNGNLVVVRELGCKLYPTLSCFKSKTLAVKSVVYDGELFEDPYCGSSSTNTASPFPGGLENGKGKQKQWAIWKRPGRGEGLYDRLGVKLFGSVSPNDIEQGGVGDCWLLATVAALAEFPAMVRKLFNGRTTLSLKGRYSVTLWSWKLRSWRTFDIDDRLAVKGDHATDPAFAKITADGELWVALLEKAAAVLCGGFDFIDGNQPTFALGMLTGSDQVYHFKRTTPGHPGGTWTGYREEFTEDCCPTYMSKFDGSYLENDRANGKVYAYTHSDGAWPGGKNGEEPRKDGDMWAALRRWDSKNYVMLCDTCGFGNGKTDQHTFPCGLPYSHAYSLIRVESNVGGSGINLVQIRNPHGTNEPDLKWKDGDVAWKQHPEVKAALKPEFKDDGSFWMSDQDFFKHFGNIFVLKCPMDKHQTGQRTQMEIPGLDELLAS